MFQERSLVRHLDISIVATVVALVLIGLTAIYSATNASGAETGHQIFKRQILWVFLGTTILLGASFVPLRLLHEYAYPLFILSILLLVVVLVVGSGAGTKRWLVLGGFRLQPSELAALTSTSGSSSSSLTLSCLL